MSEQPFPVVLLCLIRSTLSGRELVQRGSLGRNDALFSLSPFGAGVFPSVCPIPDRKGGRWYLQDELRMADAGMGTPR